MRLEKCFSNSRRDGMNSWTWILAHFRTTIGWDPAWNRSRLSITVPYSSNIARLARSERSPTLRITSLLHCKRWAYCTGWNPLQRFKMCNTSYLEAQNTRTTSWCPHRSWRLPVTCTWNSLLAWHECWPSRLAKFDVCATYQKDQQKEPLISHKIPNRQWETGGCDIFHFEDRDYLCAVDYYSSYFEIDQLKDKTGNEVIETLKRHFSTHGIPNRLQTDNGPLYSFREF